MIRSGAGRLFRKGRVAGGSGASLLSNPVVALLGPSTTRRNNDRPAGVNMIYNMMSGPHVLAHMMFPGFTFYVFESAVDPRGFTGNNYGDDSSPIATQMTLIPTIKASQAKIVIWNSGRGTPDIFAGQTVNGYCDQVKTGLLDLKSSGKLIVWENLWPRGTGAGGIWGPGGEARQLIRDINAAMLPWCNANGIVYIDLYTQMVNPSDPNLDPYPNYLTNDFIHFAAPGALAAGDLYKLFYQAVCAPYIPYNRNTVANRAPSNDFAGTGGLFANGAAAKAGAPISGIPDNFTLTRSNAGNARAVEGSIEIINGERFVVIDIGSSGVVGSSGEGLSLRYSTTSVANLLEVNKWYRGRCEIQINNWDGFTAFNLIGQDAAATPHGSSDGAGGTGNGGEIANTGFTATDFYRLRPGMARTFELWTQPFKATTTTGTFRFNASYLTATGAGQIKIGRWDFEEVPDPTTLV